MQIPQFRIDTLPVKYRDAAAVVLADYDCIDYHGQPETRACLLPLSTTEWLQTIHLHRSRYYVNSPEGRPAASRSSLLHPTDITDVTFHKTTVMGIRVIKPDGSTRTVNTFPYFKPQITR